MLESVKESKRRLMELCRERLTQYGFDPKGRGQSVYKTTPFGKWAFHLNYLESVYGLQVIADVAVRFDAVEDLVNFYPVNDLLKDAERRHTFTVGTNFGVGGRPPQWEIEFEREILEAAASIMELFMTEGIEFLERNSTLEGAFRTLESDLSQRRRSLTLAYLLQEEARFEAVARSEKERLAQDEVALQKFKVLEQELRSRAVA
jgi:hypothetical protein